MKIQNRKIVIINQAANYLTIGICNEFEKKLEKVALITGSIHVQGEELNHNIEITSIHKWKEEHGVAKALNYMKALVSMWYLLLTKYRKHEVLFISVPPMGYLLNILLPHKFSMIIWDVFPDTLKITGMKENHLVYKIWKKLNFISFKKAYKIFTIGEKMADLIAQYTDKEKLIIQPIWSIFQQKCPIAKNENVFVKRHNLENMFVVQYSGNIGLTHKVETMVDLAERFQNRSDILFQIIGRGPRKKVLEEKVKDKNLQNCRFLSFQSDEDFPYSLAAADLGVVILDEITSKGSVPSKSYNLMSYGIPSLYIASEDSELHHYATKFQHGRCFSEQELDKAEAFILELAANKEMYNTFSDKSIRAAQNFKRDNAAKFVKAYLA